MSRTRATSNTPTPASVLALTKPGEQGCFFSDPGTWTGNSQPTGKPSHHQMMIVAVCNPAGEAAFIDQTKLDNLRCRWGHKLQMPGPANPDPAYTFRGPRALQTIMEAQLNQPHARTCPIPSNNPLGNPTFGCEHALVSPPAEEAGDTVVAYTDGSCLKEGGGGQSIGAAVYFPQTKETIRINPRGQGPTNTINRAELSAIHQAVISDIGAAAPVLHLYTDSACSISCIHRILNAPWTVSILSC